MAKQFPWPDTSVDRINGWGLSKMFKDTNYIHAISSPRYNMYSDVASNGSSPVTD